MSKNWTEVFSSFNAAWDSEGWVPVERELPESSGSVLIVTICSNSVGITRRGDVALGQYLPQFREWWILSARNHVPISPPTHWMPLPEPPNA